MEEEKLNSKLEEYSFNPQEQSSSGSYGTVRKGWDNKNHCHVAIKGIKDCISQIRGICPHILRQISILNMIEHPNIVKLRDYFTIQRNMYLIFEFMDFNLAELLSHQRLTNRQIQIFMKQLLISIQHSHNKYIMHRDLKPQNILLQTKNNPNIQEWRLCVADWGMSRRFQLKQIPYTVQVVTKSYRSPELLLEYKYYNEAIDIWSIGCIFAEMYLGRQLFQNETQYKLIEQIFQFVPYQQLQDPIISGLIQLWSKKQIYIQTSSKHKANIYKLQNQMDIYSFNLLQVMVIIIQNLLKIDPKNRCNAAQALSHQYFTVNY